LQAPTLPLRRRNAPRESVASLALGRSSLEQRRRWGTTVVRVYFKIASISSAESCHLSKPRNDTLVQVRLGLLFATGRAILEAPTKTTVRVVALILSVRSLDAGVVKWFRESKSAPQHLLM
jgi:hypothetical protein